MSDPAQRRFEGVAVPEPEFSGDDGAADPRLVRVLTSFDDGVATLREVVDVLSRCRLMTPLLAVLEEPEESAGGLRQEKSSHMASVSLVSADGRRGLLAFSSVRTMSSWDPSARGIPAPAHRVAAAALEEGADAVLLDLAGPTRVAISRTALRCLASGAPVPPPFADPAVGAAVLAALDGLDGILDLVLEPPPGVSDGSAQEATVPDLTAPDLLVLVEGEPLVDVRVLAQRVAERLMGDPLVAELCPRGVAVGVSDALSHPRGRQS